MKLSLQLYVLVQRKFSQPILDLYDIYYSKFFKRFVTFNPRIAGLRRSVEREVTFGDFIFDTELAKKIHRRRNHHANRS